MFERYRKVSTEAQDLDLLPVMNLFMVLIPFLLMGAAFFHIAVIPTSLPTHTPEASDVPKTPTTVSVNLAITATEMSLTVSSTSLDEEQLAALAGTWPKTPKGYDLPALTKHLKGLKAQYPKSNTIIVLPEEKVPYDQLVGILDASRDYLTGKKDANGDEARADLFPVAVFSRFIPAEPEAGAGSELEVEAAESTAADGEGQP